MVTKRTKKQVGLPEGFTAHKGGDIPVDPSTYVIAAIRTSEGLGFNGPTRAGDHEWKHDRHEDGLGAIVGYRLAARNEPVDLTHRWSEK